MRAATSLAARPAALTRQRACRRIGSAPPTSSTKPPCTTCAATSGLCSASIAPWSSASPSRLSMKAWLSTMPVTVECSAATACNAGSSARAEAPSIICRPSTPLARALRTNCSRAGSWSSCVATSSLPQRRWATPRDSQYGTSMRRPSTHSRVFSQSACEYSPAWMTSLLRALVMLPIAPSASTITTSLPARASARAIARPTTPAPTTTVSTCSTLRRSRRRSPARGACEPPRAAG